MVNGKFKAIIIGHKYGDSPVIFMIYAWSMVNMCQFHWFMVIYKARVSWDIPEMAWKIGLKKW